MLKMYWNKKHLLAFLLFFTALSSNCFAQIFYLKKAGGKYSFVTEAEADTHKLWFLEENPLSVQGYLMRFSQEAHEVFSALNLMADDGNPGFTVEWYKSGTGAITMTLLPAATDFHLRDINVHDIASRFSLGEEDSKELCELIDLISEISSLESKIKQIESGFDYSYIIEAVEKNQACVSVMRNEIQVMTHTTKHSFSLWRLNFFLNQEQFYGVKEAEITECGCLLAPCILDKVDETLIQAKASWPYYVADSEDEEGGDDSLLFDSADELSLAHDRFWPSQRGNNAFTFSQRQLDKNGSGRAKQSEIDQLTKGKQRLHRRTSERKHNNIMTQHMTASKEKGK